jgi:hypothetical protein
MKLFVGLSDLGLMIPLTENDISAVHAHIPLGKPLLTVTSLYFALHLIFD